MIGRRRRGGMSLARVAKKAAVATVVSRTVNNVMDNRSSRNLNRNQGTQQGFNQQSLTNSCPSCRAANLEQAKFCLNCGTGLTGSAPTSSQQIIQSSCPGCQADLQGINGNFCPYCRHSI